MSAITDYLRTVRKIHRGQSATEHSYRAALAELLEAVGSGVVATNEPKHRSDCGAPDMSVTDGPGPEALKIGYIECKDIGVPLDETAKNEQLTRYRENLPNLILTDYLEFRWYVEGEERMRASLAHASGTQTRSPGAPAWTAVPEGEESLADLLTSFLARTPEPITSPEELARRMARITRMIRDIIIIEFNTGDQAGATWGLFEAFKETLLPKIKPGEFADMFAQTLAYGLFAARVNHPAGGPFTRRNAPWEIPKTNPFLRKLFGSITGPDLDGEPYVGFVDDLTRVLAHADIGAVLADFGASTRQEDPIVHFYETFLAAYDPKLREMRGGRLTESEPKSFVPNPQLRPTFVLRNHLSACLKGENFIYSTVHKRPLIDDCFHITALKQ
ncbi:MAG: hypothetical protein R6V07_03065 [Armatimonadota bacterium]